MSGAAAAEPGLLVFGGAFDPPHRTHRRILEAALRTLPVAGALVLPSGRHPHKGEAVATSDADRLDLCVLAFGGLPGVEVSDLECRRAGVGYTVDTLRELRAAHPGHRLFFLIGADNLAILDTWHDHHALLEFATIVTFPRRGFPIDRAALEAMDLGRDEIDALLAWTLDVPADDVSATTIRDALRRGETSPDLLEPVADRIQELGLYRR